MPKSFILEGKVQSYTWGGKEFIPALLGQSASSVTKAEYWLGAHANAPSIIRGSDIEVNLIDFINSSPVAVLGEPVAKRFGRLPFLFKVLDVKDMLSIQVHPTKSAAEEGFARENAVGIPLTASYRNYKDDNHKPEIMVALGDFWLLHGFLSKKELETVLSEIPEFFPLQDTFQLGGYAGLYQEVMTQSDADCKRMLKPLVERIMKSYLEGVLEESSPDYWAAKAVLGAGNDSPIDKGIYSIYFFNLLKLEAGEAIFQDAGVPHAYLEGQNIELMANSDNVLRAGLTPKHVDISELMEHVKFEGVQPHVFRGELLKDGIESVFKSPAPDFELSKISLNDTHEYRHQSQTAEILLVMDGVVSFEEEGNIIDATKGQAIFIVANCSYSLKSSAAVILYKATTPIAQ